MNKLVCLVGMCGAGKSVVADELVAKGWKFLRFGQITMDILKEKGLEVTEENERPIREGVRKEHGMGAYAILNIPKIEKLLAENHTVGDGLYSWSEYKILKEKFQDNMIVIATYASPKVRYARLDDRKLEADDAAMRSRRLTPEQAKTRDYAEIENIEKGGPISMADYLVDNSGSVEETRSQVKKIIEQIGE